MATIPENSEGVAAPRRGRPPGVKKQRAEMSMDADSEIVHAADTEDAPLTRAAAARARESSREATRGTAREQSRQTARRGAVVVEGRDGQQLTRRRTKVGDIYHIEKRDIPVGWDYQWNTCKIFNEDQVEAQLQMAENGFRPVPASRHPGRWTTPGYKGAIIIGGLRLEERPTALGDEARQEDQDRARAQMRDQTDQLRLTEKMPKHFESRGGKIKMSIDPALDIERPAYQPAED